MHGPISYGHQMFENYLQIQPSDVKGNFNLSTARHKRYLLYKLMSRYQFTIPGYWPMNTFRFFLFGYGSIAVVYTRKYGWIMGPYGVGKMDMYYNPSRITVMNPYMERPADGIIGVNAGIIKLLDDYRPLNDLVTTYAVMLAQTDKDININLMNSNVSLLLPAENAKQAGTLREAYQKATEGEPFVAINKEVLNEDSFRPMIRDLKSSFLIGDLLEARRNIVSQFLTEVGIRNVPYEKKAQMTRSETESGGEETGALVTYILENLRDSMNKVNRISGLGLSVRFSELEKEEGYGEDNPLGIL